MIETLARQNYFYWLRDIFPAQRLDDGRSSRLLWAGLTGGAYSWSSSRHLGLCLTTEISLCDAV